MNASKEQSLGQKHSRDTILRILNVPVWVQQPADSIPVTGTLLLLPGWNFDFHRWCDSTDVCSTALAKGLEVVCPQMMRSVYASRYFPETRNDLLAYPTLLWLDSALDIMRQDYGLFTKRNFVLGLSTGGRGVVLICEKKPGFFSAAAALSGDFDQSTMPKDRLITLVYGSITAWPDRWKQTDNPTTGLRSLITPIYLGHGAEDKVVPVSQTQAFYDSIMLSDYAGQIRPINWQDTSKSTSGNTKSDSGWTLYPPLSALGKPMGAARSKNASHVILHIDPNGGHDFSYWRGELPAVWAFFDRYIGNDF